MTEDTKKKAAPKVCSQCGTKLAGEGVKKAIIKRGGARLEEILSHELCPKCKRKKLANELAAAVSDRRSTSE